MRYSHKHLVPTERLRGCLGKEAELKEPWWGVQACKHKHTPYPFCEVLSGRICLVNGTQVSGPGVCVCLARGLCLFSLCNGPQLSATTQPELIGSQWAGVEAPFFFLLLWVWRTRVENLIMKFKTSHNTMLRLHDKQA